MFLSIVTFHTILGDENSAKLEFVSMNKELDNLVRLEHLIWPKILFSKSCIQF